MMRTELELWIDESGNFENDANERWNPSLVGGVLVKKGDITEEIARQMIGKEYIHYNEEAGSENIKLIEQIKQANGEFVIFENKERIKIIDGDTTYLNVLAEGIIQLLLRLSAIYGDFTLNVLIATRKNITKGSGIIAEKEYERRLRERIIVGLARNFLTRKNNWDYHIQFGDARYNALLMLADGVCNTYLTRTATGKFTDRERDIITKLYDEQYIFSFFEHSTQAELERLLAEGNVSEVIFESYLPSHQSMRERYVTLALNQLEQFDEYGQTLQLDSISSKVETLIKFDRKHEYTRPILMAMQQDLLPRLAKRNIHVPTFDLDIILYLYTLYTHEGSIKAMEQDRQFMDKLQEVTDIMTKFDYFYMYKLRRAVHEKNMLDVKGSIKSSTKAIDILAEMVELMEILDENIGENDEAQQYEILGKAYGTRGQGYTMLIHEDESNLAKAVDDFSKALQHFYLNKDKERQYLYKSQAYTEAGQFTKAIAWLYKASFIEMQENNFPALLHKWQEEHISQTIFKYHTYYKIMTSAIKNDEVDLADNMYDALVKEGIHIDQLKSQYNSAHPMQFMLWNFSTYLFAKGKERQAYNYLDEAIARCDDSGQTLRSIQLGMYAEKILMAKANGKQQQAAHVQQLLRQSLQILREEPNAHFIVSYLQELTDEDVDDPAKLHTLITLTRCIN